MSDKKIEVQLQSNGEVAWSPEMRLGAGIAPISAQTRKTALDRASLDAEIEQAKTEATAEVFQLTQFTSTQDVSQSLEGSISGSFVTNGVAVNASAAYLREVSFSSTSTTYVARWERVSRRLLDPNRLKLDGSILGSGIAGSDFASSYGTYFVVGYEVVAAIYVVIKCSSSSKKEHDKFQAALAAKQPNVFTAEGSTAFEKAASSTSTSLEVKITRVGPKDGFTYREAKAVADAGKALEEFKANNSPQRSRAFVALYNQVDVKAPRTIAVADPGIVAESAAQFVRIYGVGAALQDLAESSHQKALAAEYARVRTALLATTPEQISGVGELAKQSAKLAELEEKVAIEQLAARVKAELPEAKGKKGSEKGSTVYGFSSYTGVAVKEGTTSLKKKSPFWPTDKSHGYVELSAGKGWTLCGFQIVSRWNDGTNGEWKVEQAGPETVQVKFDSQMGRGIHFTVKFWKFRHSMQE